MSKLLDLQSVCMDGRWVYDTDHNLAIIQNHWESKKDWTFKDFVIDIRNNLGCSLVNAKQLYEKAIPVADRNRRKLEELSLAFTMECKISNLSEMSRKLRYIHEDASKLVRPESDKDTNERAVKLMNDCIREFVNRVHYM